MEKKPMQQVDGQVWLQKRIATIRTNGTNTAPTKILKIHHGCERYADDPPLQIRHVGETETIICLKCNQVIAWSVKGTAAPAKPARSMSERYAFA